MKIRYRHVESEVILCFLRIYIHRPEARHGAKYIFLLTRNGWYEGDIGDTNRHTI